MSPRVAIAALSGVVVGLLGLTLFLTRQLAEAQRELTAALSPPAAIGTNGSRPPRLRLQQLPPINLPTRVEQLDWRSIESTDYATYVANLRRVGCPEETIRDIITADVNKLFAARRRALQPPVEDWEYWLHPSDQVSSANPSDAARDHEHDLLALEHERRQMLVSLLGEGVVKAEYDSLLADALESRSLQFLPEGKRKAVAEAEARYRQAQEQIELIGNAEERREKTAAALKAYQDALGAALTPAEHEQYDLRTSNVAEGLREKLRGFGGSREEFEKLYRLENDYARERADLEAARAAGSDPQAAEKLEAAAIQLDQKIRETLGPERYADYQRTTDPDYQTLYGLAKEHDVPASVANQVWEMRHAVEAQTDRIRDNPFLTAEQKIRALDAIRDETRSAIVEVLGEPLLDEYSKQGGHWLGELTDTRRLGETDQQIVPPPLPEPEVVGVVPIPAPEPRPNRVRRGR